MTDGVSDKRLTDAARLRKLVSNALRIAVAHAEQTETDSAVLGAGEWQRRSSIPRRRLGSHARLFTHDRIRPLRSIEFTCICSAQHRRALHNWRGARVVDRAGECQIHAAAGS